MMGSLHGGVCAYTHLLHLCRYPRASIYSCQHACLVSRTTKHLRFDFGHESGSVVDFLPFFFLSTFFPSVVNFFPRTHF